MPTKRHMLMHIIFCKEKVRRPKHLNPHNNYSIKIKSNKEKDLISLIESKINE